MTVRKDSRDDGRAPSLPKASLPFPKAGLYKACLGRGIREHDKHTADGTDMKVVDYPEHTADQKAAARYQTVETEHRERSG